MPVNPQDGAAAAQPPGANSRTEKGKDAAQRRAPRPGGSAEFQVKPSSKGNAGFKGFCPNPFALEHREADSHRNKPDKRRLHYGAQKEDVKPFTLGDKENVVVTGKSNTPEPDSLKPDRRSFPGGAGSLTRRDEDPPPEVSMSYKMGGNSTARLTVNPQDDTSPLYRPAEQDGTVNSAGVYMNMDVAPDMQVQFGGEYCDVDDGRASSGATSRGASIGLKWDF